MKILILVGSSMIPPYDEFMKVQKETWASQPYKDTETLFYYAAEKTEWVSADTFTTECDNGFFWAHWRFKKALDFVWDREWDLIFRPHSSSYVDKKLLMNLCATFPKEKVYAGWKLGGYPELPLILWEGKIIKQECCSGAGFFISRDYAQILRDELPNKESLADDVLIGRTLQLHGISVTNDLKMRDISRRIDVVTLGDVQPRFHYRFNTGNRQYDMSNMRQVHRLILQK